MAAIISRILLGMALAASVAMGDEPTTKPAVPTPASLRKPTAQVDQTYREDVAKARDPDSKSALAKKLLKVADDEQAPETRYALLAKAIPIAIQAGDAATAAEVVDKMDELWRIDAMKLRAESLVKSARFLRSPEDQIGFVHLCQPIIDKAVEEKKFDAAKSLNDAAMLAAQRGNDPALAKQLAASGAEIVERRTAESRVTYARSTLKTKPQDPAANSAVGKYECYIENNWPDGLAKLVNGNDTALKLLAAKDLDPDAKPDAKAATADAWWDLSRREAGIARGHIQAHAAALYKDAEPNLSGKAKDNVEKRLAEFAAATAPKAPEAAPAAETPGVSAVIVQNRSRAPEAQQVIQSVQQDFPAALDGVKQATLLYYRDGSQLAHAAGASRPLNGAFSSSPTISTANSFVFWGLKDPWTPGKYLLVYRIQSMAEFNTGNACTTDLYADGNAVGRHQVTGSEAPVGQWSSIPMIVNITAPTTAEYRIYNPQKRTIALDRIYVYAIQ